MGLNLPAPSEDAEFQLEHEVHRTGSEALGSDTVDKAEADGVDGMIGLGDQKF